jgi:hypothetical protein
MEQSGQNAQCTSSLPAAYAKKVHGRLRGLSDTYGDDCKVTLVNRNERLVNLGLAAYGTNTARGQGLRLEAEA